MIADDGRLITLTGGPGLGKTRLARECGHLLQQQARWAGGVWFCDLRPCVTIDDICSAVAAALGVPLGDEAGEPLGPVRICLQELGPTILIADNLENLVVPARKALSAWLVAAPELVVITTSREALELPGEQRHIVGPLALPDEGLFASDSAAVQLFMQRARAVTPALSSTPETLASVTLLVRKLEGNPLAIELAAARTPLITPASQLTRRQQRLELLKPASGGQSDGLWGAINASWQALDRVEQRALTQLAVFRGGASLEAAESLVAEQLVEGDNMAVARQPMDILGALLRKSVIITTVAPSMPEVRRLDLYESVSDFALVKLAESMSAESTARSRHARWFFTMAKRVARQLTGPDSVAVRKQAAADLANLVAVIEAGTAAKTPTATLIEAVEVLLAIMPLLVKESAVQQRLLQLQRAMQRSAELPPAVRARAGAHYGAALLRQGNATAGRQALDTAHAAAVESGDPGIEGLTLCMFGRLVNFTDPQSLIGPLTRAIALLNRDGWRAIRNDAQSALALVQVAARDYEAAQRSLERAIVDCEASPHIERLGKTLNNYGMLNATLGRWQESSRLLERALAAASDEGNLLLEGVIRGNLGEWALIEGRLADAQTLFEASGRLARKLGNRRQVGLATAYLATLAHVRGELDQARVGYADALDILSNFYRDDVSEGLLRSHQALLDAQMGRGDAAASGFERAQAHLLATGDAMLDVAHQIHRLTADAALGATTSEEAMRQAAAIVAQAEVTVKTLEPPIRLHQVYHAHTLLLSSLGTSPKPTVPAGATAHASAPTPPVASVATVGPETRYITPAFGDPIDLRRRPNARRVIALLAERRLSQPGASVDVQDVFDAGWPGDQVNEPYRSNRVYVMITRLRVAGLGELLIHDGEGYLLDPSQGLVRASA